MPISLRSLVLGILLTVPFVFAIACSDDDSDSGTGVSGTSVPRATTPPGTTGTSTGSSSLQGAESQLCSDLDGLSLALSQLNTVNSGTTVAQLQTINQNIKLAMEDVKDSAAEVRSIKLSDLEDAYDDFESAVDDVSGTTTLGTAATTVQEEASAVTQAERSLETQVPCP